MEADGFRYELREVSPFDLEEKLYEANDDPNVHGIMIYYPVFGKDKNAYTTGWPLHVLEDRRKQRFHFSKCGWLLLFYFLGGDPSFFGGSQDDYLRDSVSFKKDVEGLSFTYRFNLYRNIRFMDEDGDQQFKCLLPCTALSVVKILEGIGVYDNT